MFSIKFSSFLVTIEIGNFAYSFEKTLGQGQVVVALDRNEFGMSEFNKGNYEVVAHIGELFLTSAKFVVK